MEYTRLYFFRHGEVVGHDEGRFNGATDVGLTDKGRKQMNAAVGKLDGAAPAAVYSSDLSRARYGGQAIADAFGLKLNIEPGFREHNFGDWEGMTFKEIRKKFPKRLDRAYNDMARFRPNNGESLKDLAVRVNATLDNVLKKHHGETIALVAHAGVNRVILTKTLDMKLSNIFKIEQTYGCLNIIDFYDDHECVIKLING